MNIFARTEKEYEVLIKASYGGRGSRNGGGTDGGGSVS